MSHLIAELGFGRTFGTVTNGLIGNSQAALSVTAAALGGFFANPVRVPLNLNRRYLSRLFVDISPTATSAVPGVFAVLDVLYTVQTPGNARRSATITVTWPIPNPWSTTDISRVLFDAGAGLTFPENFFEPADLLGVRITRNGPAAGDTFAGTINIAQAAQLDYLKLYPWECGP